MKLGASMPDIWIDPKKSITFEVKASELSQTNSFATKYTLRFPRIVSVRWDKNWYDCCTLDEFNKFTMVINTLSPVIIYIDFIFNIFSLIQKWKK